MKDPMNAINAVNLLAELHQRYQHQDGMHEFAVKFIQLCLTEYIYISLSQAPKGQVGGDTSFRTDRSMKEEAEADEIHLKLKVGCLLKMIGKLVLNSTGERK